MRYDMDMAKKLFEGKGHDEDEEDLDPLQLGNEKPSNAMYMSKDVGFNNDNKFEIFESALIAIVSRSRFDFKKI